TLNIIRTLQPDLSPQPNVSSFGGAGSLYAQLFYAGIEQFYCQADSCAQELDGEGAVWTCQNLQCTCRPNTSFCGAVPATNLTAVINDLGGTLTVSCAPPNNDTRTASCSFGQSTLQALFGSGGLPLDGCTFGECVRQSVIDTNGNSTSVSTAHGGSQLSGGVIAGLAVVGGLLLLALSLLALGFWKQRSAKLHGPKNISVGGIAVEWDGVSYTISSAGRFTSKLFHRSEHDDKVVLDSVSGKVLPGQMMAILGPSGAGKTTLVEILAGKNKSGVTSGTVSFPVIASSDRTTPRIGFVPQQDILPPTLTVYEALLFGARLRLPESVPEWEKRERIERILAKLGIDNIRNSRIGHGAEAGGGKARGISGGEMRRVSIGLELIASPDILILDEPTSGLDSVSAAKVANALHAIAHDPEHPTTVLASIHQPSSKLYQTFDSILLLSYGRALYSGPGRSAPAAHFASHAATLNVPICPPDYNTADYLLEVASDPPVGLFQVNNTQSIISQIQSIGDDAGGMRPLLDPHQATTPVNEKTHYTDVVTERTDHSHRPTSRGVARSTRGWRSGLQSPEYATTFLTQLEILCGREMKILRRDYTLFFTHIAVASVLGVFCGGLYFQTGITIAGFQSRVGCLFFLGALIAFSSLSALYNVVETRPLFLRERSSSYYSPSAWLLSRFLFDVIPLRIIPTIIVSTITYWMAGLAPDAEHFFKFLFILVLYTLAMTLFNFLLGTLFRNGGIAILLSALSALYQMTFAGFFVHLNDIPPVLRWLQWLCPLKYTLEALSVNEVGAGLMIQDTLEGVPVNVSASLIMNMLFGFGSNNYYRDVLVLFGFIAGFGIGVIAVVWIKVRERR
ncbi:ATP-binding cassette subfamily G transporter, partial [Pleurotus pulmonarius]